MRRAPLTGITSATLDSCLVRNPPFTGNLVEVTSLGGGGGSYDDSDVRILISINTAAVANNVSQLASKATTTALTTGLAGKQDTIQDGDLNVARTSGLQASLDSKATTFALTAGLAAKQDTIQDGDLSIARTSGLQTSLDSKQATLGMNSGSGSYLPASLLSFDNSNVALGAQTGQVVITCQPSISQVGNLTTELAAKANKAKSVKIIVRGKLKPISTAKLQSLKMQIYRLHQ